MLACFALHRQHLMALLCRAAPHCDVNKSTNPKPTFDPCIAPYSDSSSHCFVDTMLWSISTYISSNISSIVLFLLFVRYLVTLNKSKRLPKGPSGLPLIGYLPFLGKNPHYTLWKLGDKYGSIYTLPLGEQNIVILNDWESIRDALRKDSFLGRPQHSSFSLVTGIKSLIDDNHASWRENRRVFEGLFRTCFDSPTIHKNLLNELKTLLIYLKKSNGIQIEFRAKMSKFIDNFFYSFIFGKHFVSPKYLCDSSHFIKIAILSLYPSWMAKVYYKSLDIFNRCHFALFAKFFRNATRNHYKTINNETSVRDLIDGYILEMQAHKSNQTSTTMSIDKLRANCQIFLCFGSEAFLSCIEWSLISVAYFPQYQKIISEEIMAVIGPQRIPELKDEPRIPFTLAFLNEVLRWKTVFPFNFMRRATEDATILGHFIPKDTLVLANIWAVHHDPHIWENPSQFNPYRFLSDNCKTVIDHEGFMPFSLGKRSCVAEPFVRKLLLIYFVAIVQKFSITLFNEDEAFEEEFHITLRPKGSVQLVFRLRSKENDVNI